MIGSLTARLLDATAEDHGVLETTPFVVALQSRDLPPLKLYEMLQAHHIMAGVLERCIRASDNAMLQRLWREDMAKADLLASDLVTVGARVPHAAAMGPSPAVASAVTEYAQYAKYAAAMQPLALAGYLFAHEGSMIEAPAIRAHVAVILGVKPSLVRYYNAYPDPMGRWRRFRQQLEAHVVTNGQQNVVVAGARDAFRLIRSLYEALSEDAEYWPSMREEPAPQPRPERMGVVMARARHDSTGAVQAF